MRTKPRPDGVVMDKKAEWLPVCIVDDKHPHFLDEGRMLDTGMTVDGKTQYYILLNDNKGACYAEFGQIARIKCPNETGGRW